MSSADAQPGLFKRVTVGAVTLAVGLVILSQIVGVGVAGLGSVDGSIRVGGDGVVVLQNNDDVSSVRDSTGRAADLSGGHVAISGGLGVRDDSDRRWTFATYSSVDDSTRASTLWSFGKSYVIAYTPGNGGEYVAWYYNASTTNSYSVSVSADSPGSVSPLLLERDGTTLTLYNESGSSSSVTITPGADSSAALPTSNNLEGKLEETRTWKRPLSASERQTYRSDGIEPVAVGNRSARLLFDRTGDDVAIEFRNAEGDLEGAASRGDGLVGSTMARGTDFEIVRVNGDDAVKPLVGGELENQPRIAVTTPRSTFEKFVLALGGAFGLAGIVLIAAISRRVLEVLQR
jgi:hypothetical protein